MTPITREEIYLYKLSGGSVTMPSPVSRKEMYLAKACGELITVPDPVSREEMYLYKLAGGSVTLPTPISRLELLMAAACGEAVVPYDPVSRLEWFWSQLSAPVQTITGVPPITFTADGTPLISWSMLGNGQQTGTPTPDAPIMPDFVGTLSGSDWTIPITCAGQTMPVYLGQTQTVRRVGKLVLTGAEQSWARYRNGAVLTISSMKNNMRAAGHCSHFTPTYSPSTETMDAACFGASNNLLYLLFSNATASALNITDLNSIKQWLQDEFAAGTPVTVWYVLATPETSIVNEPLAKIGDYADELHSTDAGVTIQTVSGINTLTIGTDLQPSSVSITGRISQ